MATVNGRSMVFFGKSYAEIGELLRDASPAKDGVGLTVVLDEQEQDTFARHYGMNVGKTISTYINAAIRAKDGTPNKFRWAYADFSFTTEAISSETGESQ